MPYNRPLAQVCSVHNALFFFFFKHCFVAHPALWPPLKGTSKKDYFPCWDQLNITKKSLHSISCYIRFKRNREGEKVSFNDLEILKKRMMKYHQHTPWFTGDTGLQNVDMKCCPFLCADITQKQVLHTAENFSLLFTSAAHSMHTNTLKNCLRNLWLDVAYCCFFSKDTSFIMHVYHKAFSHPQSVKIWSAAEWVRDKECLNTGGHMEGEAHLCMSVCESVSQCVCVSILSAWYGAAAYMI